MSAGTARRFRGVILVAAGALVADLLAIASGYAATTKFPQPLHLIQQHPWWSVAIFSIVALLIMILLYLHDNADNEGKTTPSSRQGNEEINVEDSKLKKSGIRTARGARIRIARSKLNKSPVVIVTDRRDQSPSNND